MKNPKNDCNFPSIAKTSHALHQIIRYPNLIRKPIHPPLAVTKPKLTLQPITKLNEPKTRQRAVRFPDNLLYVAKLGVKCVQLTLPVRIIKPFFRNGVHVIETKVLGLDLEELLLWRASRDDVSEV